MKINYSQLMVMLLATWWSSQVSSDNHGPLVGLEFLEIVNQRITNIDTEELSRLIDQDPSLVIIDARQESEVNGLGGMMVSLPGRSRASQSNLPTMHWIRCYFESPKK